MTWINKYLGNSLGCLVADLQPWPMVLGQPETNDICEPDSVLRHASL